MLSESIVGVRLGLLQRFYKDNLLKRLRIGRGKDLRLISEMFREEEWG
jgi:hypothetical protein